MRAVSPFYGRTEKRLLQTGMYKSSGIQNSYGQPIICACMTFYLNSSALEPEQRARHAHRLNSVQIQQWQSVCTGEWDRRRKVGANFTISTSTLYHFVSINWTFASMRKWTTVNCDLLTFNITCYLGKNCAHLFLVKQYTHSMVIWHTSWFLHITIEVIVYISGRPNNMSWLTKVSLTPMHVLLLSRL